MEELKRRIASAKAWGEPAELMTPGEIKELTPFVNTDIILGGFWSPTVGVVDSLRAGTLMREKAQDPRRYRRDRVRRLEPISGKDGRRLHTAYACRTSDD
jgi:glycine/D-amino acid oxidase-like deaminating enzyme